MTSFGNVMEQAVKPESPTTQRSRKQWESESPESQIAACQKAWYGAVEPILEALANGDDLPVKNIDLELVHQFEGLFEATLNSYKQKTTSRATA
jgi:hypothetical protein